LVKVFQDEEVMSIADARLKIEEDFEHNFLPDRDLVDFLAHKQGLIEKMYGTYKKPSIS
jgi:hypothetical protein